MEKVTPLCWVIHASNSAKILNNFGADRSPKGRQVSKYIAFSHSIAKKCLSVGWTGSNQNAFLMSSFASSVFGPIAIIWLMASSTEIYETAQRLRYAIINTVTLWVGQIDNEPPLIWLMILRYDTKTVYLHPCGVPSTERPCYSLIVYLGLGIL